MSCVKVDFAVLGSQCLTVSVDVKHHERRSEGSRAKDLCESRGGRSGLPVPDSPYALCEHKATVNLNSSELELIRAQELCESELAVLGYLSPISLMVSVKVRTQAFK